MYGLKISETGGEPCLRLNKSNSSTCNFMYKMLHAWQLEAAKLENSEITKEAYDEWRYKYPELDTVQHWAKVPSQGLSDMLMAELKKEDKKNKNSNKK